MSSRRVLSANHRARAHRARVVEEPTEHICGERECCVEHLAGHRWELDETVRDLTREDYGCATVTTWPAYERDAG